jgi:YidC/Oxa1 family membrane protein insertase
VDTLLSPLLFVVSWIMIGWHALFATVLGISDGLSWTLSIVGLVVVIRILLIPLFVRQIKASRAMAVLQPQVRELQKKYGNDRERMSQEMMKLYKDAGTNPFASCLPILLQAPFFFSLFRVLDGIAIGVPRGAFAGQEALFESARQATLFGVPLSSSFRNPIPPGLPADITATVNVVGVQVVAGVLVAIMVATTFLTQRQLMRKNMPAAALEGPFAQQQKILLYVLPLTFLFSGYWFPIGVVLYWCISNIWTMGQQFYVIRRMPAPGTPAEEAYKRRLAAKAARRGGPPPPPTPEPGGTGPTTTAAPPPPPPPPRPPGRQQPKRTTRAQRKGSRKS